MLDTYVIWEISSKQSSTDLHPNGKVMYLIECALKSLMITLLSWKDTGSDLTFVWMQFWNNVEQDN